MIGRALWALALRLLGDGARMTDETYEAILAAIREDMQTLDMSAAAAQIPIGGRA